MVRSFVRDRRGLSTMIGAMIFIGILVAGINFSTWQIAEYDNFAQAVSAKNQLERDRQNERLEIDSARISNGKFNVTVKNYGAVSARIIKLWVTNETANPPWRQSFDLNTYLNPGQTVKNLGQNLALTGKSQKTYSLKMITERGNVVEFQVLSGPRVQVNLYAPATIYPGAKINVMVAVTNNASKSNNIVDLTPTLSISAPIMPTYISGPTPSKVSILKDGNTALFTWVYKMPATETSITFNGSFTGAPSGVFSTQSVGVTSPESAKGATTATFASAAKRLGILISGVANPSDTQGSPIGKGKWGIGVVNPLNRTILVYGVSFTTPTVRIFQNPIGRTPSTGWALYSTPSQSVVYWQDTPVTIPAYSVKEFTVEIQGDTGAKNTPIYIEALTSEGKYVITHTITAGTTMPTINVFYTGTPLTPDSDWTFIMPNIKGGVQRTFNVTVQNKSDTDSLGSEIVLQIIIPQDFTNVQADTIQVGWDSPTIILNPDGSATISVNTTATTILPGPGTVFSFRATPPSVTSPFVFTITTTAIYPQWNDIRTASAVSDAAVQVVP